MGNDSKITVYIVLHHEIFPDGPEGHRKDEMVFHIASSLAKALAYIKAVWVVRYSWWEIQKQILDDGEWPRHVGYYGRGGGKLKTEPWAKCVAIFKKQKMAEKAGSRRSPM